jgi:hypothetical protein
MYSNSKLQCPTLYPFHFVVIYLVCNLSISEGRAGTTWEPSKPIDFMSPSPLQNLVFLTTPPPLLTYKPVVHKISARAQCLTCRQNVYMFLTRWSRMQWGSWHTLRSAARRASGSQWHAMPHGRCIYTGFLCRIFNIFFPFLSRPEANVGMYIVKKTFSVA